MATYEKSEYYEMLANKIIDARPELQFIREEEIRIGYLESDQHKTNKKKIVCADCEKVSDKNKAFIPYDFIITVYTENMDYMSSAQEKVLIWHELLHVGAEDDKFWAQPHDLEDFYILTKRFGVDWNEEGKELEVGDFFG